MTVHFMTQDLADEAAVVAIEITEIEITNDDCMNSAQWTEFMLGARDLRRRVFSGVELMSGTAADGRMFSAMVADERALVEFTDFMQQTGATGSAANDDAPQGN